MLVEPQITKHRRAGAPVELDLSVYVFALVGAGLGAGLIFLIAALMPSIEMPDNRFFDRGSRALEPETFAPPSDPNNPYAPPRRHN